MVLGLTVTPANVDEGDVVPELVLGLNGVLLGDKGYVRQLLSDDLAAQGLTLLTPLRKNMEGYDSTANQAISRYRQLVETVIGPLDHWFDIHYIGSFVLLGHGSCPGAPGHCDRKAIAEDGLRQEHHLAPGLALLDVTEGLTKLKNNGSGNGQPLMLSLVVVDLQREQVNHEEIQFERLALSTK